MEATLATKMGYENKCGTRHVLLVVGGIHEIPIESIRYDVKNAPPSLEAMPLLRVSNARVQQCNKFSQPY